MSNILFPEAAEGALNRNGSACEEIAVASPFDHSTNLFDLLKIFLIPPARFDLLQYLRKVRRTQFTGRALTTALSGKKPGILNRRLNHAGLFGQDRKSTRLNSSHVAISYA